MSKRQCGSWSIIDQETQNGKPVAWPCWEKISDQSQGLWVTFSVMIILLAKEYGHG